MSPNTFSLAPSRINAINNNMWNPDDFDVDKRIGEFLKFSRWQLYTKYKGNRVDIPGFPGSKFHVTKYFQVVKKPGEPNYNESQEENEIGCTIEAGWPGYDTEVIINLFITGKDVLSGQGTVKAEILQTGSAKMVLTFKDKIITDFRERHWWKTISTPKVWESKMDRYL